MSYIFLLDAGEESSAECLSDIPASVLLRLNLIVDESYSNAKGTESSQSSQSGMTCKHLTVAHGGESLILYPVGFHAKKSPRQDREKASTGSEADCGPNSLVSLAKYDPDTHSLKTRQTLLFEDCTESLVILPAWGWMHAGECFLLAPQVPHICDDGCSLWPTPRVDGRDNCGGSNARKKAIKMGTYIGRYPNPVLQERLMGWPTAWTDLEPLETAKFRQWLSLLGKL